MRVDRIIGTLKQVLHALDNRLTAQDNLQPTGLSGVRVLTSTNPNVVPSWAEITPDGVIQLPGTPGVSIVGPPGPPGAPGPPGDPGADGEFAGHWEPMAFDCEVLFDSECDVVMGWFNP